MEFNLLGKSIEISEGRKNYMKILAYYKAMAAQAERDFKQEYENIFGSVFLNSTWADKFKKTYGSNNYMDNIVKRYVTKTRQYLVNYGVYNLSDSVIWNEGIIKSGRRTSRLQYEFDAYIQGCLKRNEDDDAFISRLKSTFNGNYFSNCLCTDIMSLCDFALAYLDDNEITEIQFVYEQDASEAEGIYQNLRSYDAGESTKNQRSKLKGALQKLIDEGEPLNEIELQKENIGLEAAEAKNAIENTTTHQNSNPAVVPKSVQRELAVQLLELDPRKREYYEYIFKTFLDAKYEIASIASYLSIDLSDLIEKELQHNFDLKFISCEEDALKMLDDLKLSMEKFCVTTSSRKDELEKILYDFDVKARTYDGVLYDTRELCAMAQRDDRQLNYVHGDIDSADKEACKRFLKEIAHIDCMDTIKNKHLQALNERITDIDNEVLKGLLKTLDESDETECNRLKEEIDQYDAPEETKAPYISQVEKRIYEIWDEEDFDRFKTIYLQTPVTDTEQIEKNCVLISTSGRTQIKEAFIKALHLLSDTEVEAAAKYAIAKESGLFASIINMGKKETYETLTLNGRVLHPAIQNAIDAVRSKKGNSILSNLTFGKKKAKTPPAQENTGSTKFCSECGAKIAGTAKFCPNCGAKSI